MHRRETLLFALAALALLSYLGLLLDGGSDEGDLSEWTDAGRWPRFLQSDPEPLGRVRIAHVVNLYAPLDDDRSFVVDSIELAKENLDCLGEDFDLEIVAAVHPNDVDVVPASFDGHYKLTKFYQGRYPLVQDIFDGALANSDFDYLIHTNADIVLHPKFYCTVAGIIKNRQLDAFTINRKTVPHDTTLEEIANGSVRDAQKHPGHDCWVVKRPVLEQMNLGRTFVGFPPFAAEIMLQMGKFAPHGHNYHSFALAHGTYHRGDDKAWREDNGDHSIMHNIVSALCGEENRHDFFCGGLKGTGARYHRCKMLGKHYHGMSREEWCERHRHEMHDVEVVDS